MRILLAGASGLIGHAVARALICRGHEVVRTGRHAESDIGAGGASLGIAVDFAQPPDADWWQPRLLGFDAVVNAVGIFQQGRHQSFESVHTRAPIALFTAAAAARVPLVVQISALGSDGQAATPFHQSKYAADKVLRELPVRSVIVQPSLVYAPRGASATLFNQLALAPLLALPSSREPVQPVHLDDLTDLIVGLVERPPAERTTTLAAVGPTPLGLRDYLLQLRAALGARLPPIWVDVPMPWILKGARWLSAILPPGWSGADALQMLARGNHADPGPFAQRLGRAPRPVQQFLAREERRDVRQHAEFLTLLALMRYSVAVVWIATGVLSLGLYPVQGSLDLLRDFGLEGTLAHVALYMGAVLDLALGLAIFVAPPRWRAAVWYAQLIVILGYTLLITLRIPHWWLHPFGPVLKNLPMLVAISMLAARERRR